MQVVFTAATPAGEIVAGDTSITLSTLGERLAASYLLGSVIARHNGWDGMALPLSPMPLDTHSGTVRRGDETFSAGFLSAASLYELRQALRQQSPAEQASLPLELTHGQSSTLLTLARSCVFDETHASSHTVATFDLTDVREEAARAVARNTCGLLETVGSLALTVLSKKRPPKHEATFRAYTTMLAINPEITASFRVSGKKAASTAVVKASRKTTL